jgi:hypothetical protein
VHVARLAGVTPVKAPPSVVSAMPTPRAREISITLQRTIDAASEGEFHFPSLFPSAQKLASQLLSLAFDAALVLRTPTADLQVAVLKLEWAPVLTDVPRAQWPPDPYEQGPQLVPYQFSPPSTPPLPRRGTDSSDAAASSSANASSTTARPAPPPPTTTIPNVTDTLLLPDPPQPIQPGSTPPVPPPSAAAAPATLPPAPAPPVPAPPNATATLPLTGATQ